MDLNLNEQPIFPTLVYNGNWSEFIDVTREVALENLQEVKENTELHEIYPVYMSPNISDDPRLKTFVQSISQHAWNILNHQGYAMKDKSTYTYDFWMQEHYKHSLMERHIHGFGAQIVGFYFLDTPENCSNLVFHDPRSAKVQINLPDENVTALTNASSLVNFSPKPGDIFFTNSWLPHSFGRHGSDEPIRFIHFNVYVEKNVVNSTACPLPAEIV